MSEEDVEALKAVYESWGAGNFWTSDIFDSDVELVWAGEVPDLPAARGPSAIGSSMRTFLTSWDECRWEADKFIPAQWDRVLVLFTARARGKGSSVEVEAHWAHLWTFRAGKATRLEGFIHQSEALEAAGLSE